MRPRVLPRDASAASQVPDLFYKTFGYTYSDTWRYDGAEVRRRVESGDVYPFYVGDEAGRLVGYFDYFFTYGGHEVIALGVLVIDPDLSEIQNLVVLNTLLKATVTEIGQLAREKGLKLIVTTDSLDHKLTQRLSGRFGLKATGLTLGSVPAGKHRFHGAFRPSGVVPDEIGAGSGHRRCEVFSACPLPQVLTPYETPLPESFGFLTRPTYDELALPVTFVGPRPPSGQTLLDVGHNVPRGMVTLDVSHVGQDALSELRRHIDHFRAGGVPVIQIIIPTGPSDIDPLLDTLASREEALYAALLPRFKGSDAVMMQIVDDIDPHLTRDRVLEPGARRVLDYVRAASSMTDTADSHGLSDAIREA